MGEGDRRRKKDHGRAEAILIAAWGLGMQHSEAVAMLGAGLAAPGPSPRGRAGAEGAAGSTGEELQIGGERVGREAESGSGRRTEIVTEAMAALCVGEVSKQEQEATHGQGEAGGEALRKDEGPGSHRQGEADGRLAPEDLRGRREGFAQARALQLRLRKGQQMGSGDDAQASGQDARNGEKPGGRSECGANGGKRRGLGKDDDVGTMGAVGGKKGVEKKEGVEEKGVGKEDGGGKKAGGWKERTKTDPLALAVAREAAQGEVGSERSVVDLVDVASPKPSAAAGTCQQRRRKGAAASGEAQRVSIKTEGRVNFVACASHTCAERR